MKHVCFVGDSHLGAIKRGWDKIATDTLAVDAVFFGAPQPVSNTLTYRCGKLRLDDGQMHLVVSTAPNGGAVLDITPFDAIVFCGLGLTPLALFYLYKTYRGDFQRGADTAKHILSRAAYEAVCRGMYEDTQAVKLARTIGEDMRKPAWLIPASYPSELILWSRRKETVTDIINNEDEETIVEAFDSVLRDLSNSGINVLKQPPETKSSTAFTNQIYSTGSKRLTDEVELHDLDFVHMNADYGALVLKVFVKMLAETNGSSGAPGIYHG
ncbi:hypothetical protein BH10PSE7_BH10PSE7_09620 [soil metagenome]